MRRVRPSRGVGLVIVEEVGKILWEGEVGGWMGRGSEAGLLDEVLLSRLLLKLFNVVNIMLFFHRIILYVTEHKIIVENWY